MATGNIKHEVKYLLKLFYSCAADCMSLILSCEDSTLIPKLIL